MQSVDLTNNFLIAMPNMADPYFAKSLTFICEHNEQGALGVVINRPIELSVQSLLDQVDIKLENQGIGQMPVHFGGPVQMDRGFVLHTPVGEWQSTLMVNDEIGLTTSKDILEAVASGAGPSQFFITLGYAGWAPGQLEHEISQNAWLTVAASRGLIFDVPIEERFERAVQLLGVDLSMLSDEAGHA